MAENKEKVSQEKKANNSSKGLAIAGMVVGIVALTVLCWTGIVGAVVAIIALVLSIVSLAMKMDGKGMAIAGVCTGAVALVVSIIFTILYVTIFKVAEDVIVNTDWAQAAQSLEEAGTSYDKCLEEHGLKDVNPDSYTPEQIDVAWVCMFGEE